MVSQFLNEIIKNNQKIKINILSFAFYYMMFFLLFSGLIGFRVVWHISIVILGVYMLCKYPQYIRSFSYSLSGKFFIISLVLVVMSLLTTGGNDVFFLMTNIRSLAYSFFVLVIMMIVVERKNELVFELFEEHILFFNILLIINMIVVAFQAQGTGMFMRQEWLEGGQYIDQVAGLFGDSSTPHLGLFTVLVMLINLSYARRHMQRYLKAIFWGYTFLMMTLMGILSKYNDNTGYYIIMPMFLILYSLYTTNMLTKYRSTRILKNIGYVVIGVFVFVLFINLPAIREIRETYVDVRIYSLLNYQAVGVTGSNTRLFQIYYGLTHDFGWLLGKGFATAELTCIEAHGFKFFGNCSMAGFVILGGVWLFLAYTMMYTNCLYDMVRGEEKKSVVLFFTVFVVLVIFSLYKPTYNDARTVLFICLYALLFNHLLKGKIDSSFIRVKM